MFLISEIRISNFPNTFLRNENIGKQQIPLSDVDILTSLQSGKKDDDLNINKILLLHDSSQNFSSIFSERFLDCLIGFSSFNYLH